jgi:anthranilate phosphoribosyltransferase
MSMQALGVAIDLGPEGVARCIEEAGVGFMFAPVYHPAMAAVVPVRKALRIRTAFNMLGPMLNPARAAYGLVGVYSPSVSHLMADALERLGMKKVGAWGNWGGGKWGVGGGGRREIPACGSGGSRRAVQRWAASVSD